MWRTSQRKVINIYLIIPHGIEEDDEENTEMNEMNEIVFAPKSSSVYHPI